MFSMLPTHDHTYGQPNYYTPHKPSPLSSSPLRNTTPSPLSQRDMNVQVRVPGQEEDAVMSSPSKPMFSSSARGGYANGNGNATIFTTTPESTRQTKSIHNRPSPSATPSASTLPSPPPSKIESTYSKRATKPNPLFTNSGRGNSDEGRETRRKLFLKRVRQGSEDKRWGARGGDEEIMRCLYVAEQRRVVERLRREGTVLGNGEEEEDWGMDMGTGTGTGEEEVMEELELDAMLSSLDPESDFGYGLEGASQMGGISGEMHMSTQSHQSAPIDQQSIYGSDDEEYDQVFMEVIQQESRASSQQQPDYVLDEDMMDMS